MATVGDIIRRNARRYPNKEGIVFENVRLTWEEANVRTNKLAHAIIDRGVKKGDRVAILQMNSHHSSELLFGLAKAGILSVSIRYRLSKEEIAYIINDCEANTLVVAEDFIQVVNDLRNQLPHVRRFIGIGDVPDYMEPYEKMIAPYPGEEPDVSVEEEDPFNLIYTTGTTGLPKGVLRDHRSIEVNTFHLLIGCEEIHSDDKFLTAGSFSSLGTLGFYLGFSYLGCTEVILKRFDPLAVLQSIEKEKATLCLLLPTMMTRVVDHPDFGKYDLSSLRLVLYGASPMPLETLKKTMELLPSCGFYQLYGSTETFWGVGLLPKDHVLGEQRLTSAGRELGSTEVNIIDQNGTEVPTGEAGEIIMKGRMVMREYWKLSELTQETLKDGWIYTGDIAKRDKDGYIYIVDRKSDMVISGGYNIYPAEVEGVLCAHPAVSEAAVIGIPDELWGEAVKAIVVLNERMTATEEEIIESCKQNLASYKKPKSVDFTTEPLPKGMTGKLQRKDLREKYWKGYERRVH